MSYRDDNIALIRSSGFVKNDENASLFYGNLLYPYLLDNGGNVRFPSITIDVLYKDVSDSTYPNIRWISDERYLGNLMKDDIVWGFKESFNPNKLSRSIGNAFCFGGQKIGFYIATKGHGAGYVNGRWAYCKTTMVVSVVDLVGGIQSVLKTFDDFASEESSSTRFFEWSVPEISQPLFDEYGLYGVSVLRVDVRYDLYSDAERKTSFGAYVPSSYQNIMQVLVYSPSRELADVDAGDANILTSIPSYGDGWNVLFGDTVFQYLSVLNKNALTEDQKRAIVADQAGALFISQHPVITSDNAPSKIIGFGASESVNAFKTIDSRTVYAEKYPDRISLLSDRLFGVRASYKGFTYVFDIDKYLPSINQSSQITVDPVRIIAIDKNGVLSDLFGDGGVAFDPYLLEVSNAEFIAREEDPLVIDCPLCETLVDIYCVYITSATNEDLKFDDRSIKVSFTISSGEADLSRIKYVLYSQRSKEYYEYLDDAGTSRVHTFDLRYDVVVNRERDGETWTAQVFAEDINGRIVSYTKEEYVYGVKTNPTLMDLRIYQRNDGSDIVDVWYQYNGIGEINNAIVSMEYSIDGGELWTEAISVWGDVGNNVMPGLRKLSWNIKSDLPDTVGFGTIYCQIMLEDVDGLENFGEAITGALVYDLDKPTVAIRRITEDEYYEIVCSTSSDSSSSSSSSMGYSESSSSSNSSSSSSSSFLAGIGTMEVEGMSPVIHPFRIS